MDLIYTKYCFCYKKMEVNTKIKDYSLITFIDYFNAQGVTAVDVFSRTIKSE